MLADMATAWIKHTHTPYPQTTSTIAYSDLFIQIYRVATPVDLSDCLFKAILAQTLHNRMDVTVDMNIKVEMIC